MRSSSAGWTVPELVGRGDEEHLRQVDRHFEVVVAERVVLRRVEHLEQRRRRVALEAGGHLVDLVEHEHRVHRAGLLQRLDDAAGDRADVGAAVAADLGLVAHAAERDAHELPLHRPRDRLAERRLADAGRADEAEDRPLHVAFQLADGEVLDDAFLDLVEVVVVLVEHAARFDRIEAIFGGRPTTAHRAASRCRSGASGTRATPPVMRSRRFDLAHGDGVDRLGQLGVLDALAQLRQLVAFAFAQLLLDRLQLLAQVVLTLRVGHLLLRLRLDLALQLEQRDLARQRRGDRLQLLERGRSPRAAPACRPASCRCSVAST